MDNGTDGKQKPAVPPYLPYRTFRNFIDSLKQGMPNRIDRSLMATMSGATQATVLATLRYLDLIQEHGAPTDKLLRLVNSEGVERQRVLRDMLTASYPFLFQDGFDLGNATAHSFEERFKERASGDTLRKCEAFFLAAAKDADLSVSRFITARGSRAAGNRSKGRRPRAVNGGRTPASSPDGPSEARREPPPPQPVSLEHVLLAKFPTFDPAWSEEVQSKWFDAFGRLMERVRESDVPDEGVDE